MKVRFYNIEWDIEDAENKPIFRDHDDCSCYRVSCIKDLPSEIVLDVDSVFNASEEGVEFLSKKYGWCVKSVWIETL